MPVASDRGRSPDVCVCVCVCVRERMRERKRPVAIGLPLFRSVVRAFAHGAMGRRIDHSWGGPLSYFSFQSVLHDWCNKGHGVCHTVCGMMYIKEPLLLIGKSSPCGGSGFPLSLSEWSLTICLTPHNRNYNVLSASLNKTLPSNYLFNYSFVFISTKAR